jgi:hypothetical protein
MTECTGLGAWTRLVDARTLRKKLLGWVLGCVSLARRRSDGSYWVGCLVASRWREDTPAGSAWLRLVGARTHRRELMGWVLGCVSLARRHTGGCYWSGCEIPLANGCGWSELGRHASSWASRRRPPGGYHCSLACSFVGVDTACKTWRVDGLWAAASYAGAVYRQEDGTRALGCKSYCASCATPCVPSLYDGAEVVGSGWL